MPYRIYEQRFDSSQNPIGECILCEEGTRGLKELLQRANSYFNIHARTDSEGTVCFETSYHLEDLDFFMEGTTKHYTLLLMKTAPRLFERATRMLNAIQGRRHDY